MNRTMIEIRVDDPARLTAYLEMDADIISLGSESCLHKLPETDDFASLTESIAAAGKKLRMVFPFVPQGYCDRIRDMVMTMLDLDGEVVINDLGLLWSIARGSETMVNEGSLGLGRILTRSLADVPYADHLLRDETDYVRNSCLQCNIIQSDKMEFYRNLGVNRLEVNAPPQTFASLSRLKDQGFSVWGHHDAICLAVGRACTTARHHQAAIGSCQALCTSPYRLRIKEIFARKDDGSLYSDASAELPEIFPELTVFGNTVYWEQSLSGRKSLAESFTGLIFDSRFHRHPKSLAEAIETIKATGA